MEPITVSMAKAMEITGLGKTTLYTLLEQGKITSTHVGTKRLFHVSSLRKFLECPE